MPDNLVNLVKRKPDAENIAELENLLAQAKEGHVEGFAISIICSDGCLGNMFTESVKDQLFAVLGNIRYLEQRLLDAIEHE